MSQTVTGIPSNRAGKGSLIQKRRELRSLDIERHGNYGRKNGESTQIDLTFPESEINIQPIG
jgi:hypothetical protein